MPQSTILLLAASFLNALILSSMYILLGLGFTFLFNIMGILNFAHGVIYMIGAYISFILATTVGINPWLAMLVSVIAMGLFGILLERFVFRPFLGNINLIIVVCIGIITVLKNAVSVSQTYTVQMIPPFVQGVFKVGIVSLSWERLLIFFIGVGLLILVLLFINKTKQGLQMRAVAQDKEGAILQGINVNFISALACVIACALAAVAGSLMGSYLTVNPYMGDDIMIKVLEILVLGGIGSINGVLFAGLIVGTMDAFLPIVVSGTQTQAIMMFVIVIILLFKPQGLFGKEVRA
jgi:branched-chain amino acid transport system permease protein